MKNRSYWIYGLGLGLVLVILQTIEYRVIILDLSMQWYGLAIGVLFLAAGILVGLWVANRKSRHTANQNKAEQYGLSDREIEVLSLMADGLSNQQIADALFVSLNTIKTHISNIYMKLNVQRRTQAVEKARQLELITTH